MPAIQKIIDLSQTVDSHTQVYRGDPVQSFTPAATMVHRYVQSLFNSLGRTSKYDCNS